MQASDAQPTIAWLRLAALLTSFLTFSLAGCSTTTHDEMNPEASENDGLIEIIRLPATPPVAVISSQPSADPIPGRLLVADWDDVTPGSSIRPAEPIDWPEPHAREPGAAFEIRIAAKPYWVHTMLYTAIDPVSGIPVDPETGEPTQVPVYEKECKGDGGEQCDVEVREGVIRIDSLPSAMYPDEYVMLFVAWEVPPTDDEIDAGIQDWSRRATAMWMFRFQN